LNSTTPTMWPGTSPTSTVVTSAVFCTRRRPASVPAMGYQRSAPNEALNSKQACPAPAASPVLERFSSLTSA
jgi:hypothetical protein